MNRPTAIFTFIVAIVWSNGDAVQGPRLSGNTQVQLLDIMANAIRGGWAGP